MRLTIKQLKNVIKQVINEAHDESNINKDSRERPYFYPDENGYGMLRNAILNELEDHKMMIATNVVNNIPHDATVVPARYEDVNYYAGQLVNNDRDFQNKVQEIVYGIAVIVYKKLLEPV